MTDKVISAVLIILGVACAGLVILLLVCMGYMFATNQEMDCVKTGETATGIMFAGKVPVPYTYEVTKCTIKQK